MNKINLPSDFIYEFDYEENLVDSYLKTIIDNDSSIEWKKISVQNQNGSPYANQNHNQISYGYSFPKHQEIFDWFSSCVNKVSKQCFDHENLVICDAWLTKSTFGQSSHRHKHGYSILSGLFYLHDSDCYTTFYGKNVFYESFKDSGFDPIDTKLELNIVPKKGKLIIFPSYVLHKISVHRSKEVRYTLAFNTFLNGLVSNKDTQKLNIQTLF